MARNRNTHRIIRSLVSLTLTVFILSFGADCGFAYNWPWDQGHDCVETKKGSGNWGRWDYDGNWKGTYTSKDCCELLCKICPVYANTGQLQKTFTDLTVPGVGPALNITRTYNSQEWATSLLGHGWVFNFGKRLIITRNKAGEKVVGVRLETGEKNFYKEHADGTLERLTEYGATYDLIKNSDNTYTIANRDGSRYELREDGKIAKIIDKNHNELVFSYNSVGCLSRITNASGNYIDFQLGPNGKIASVSDNLGRTVAYTYDENGNLTSVTDPLGNTRRYVYNNENLLAQIIDARGNVVESATYDNNQPPRVATFTEKGEIYTIAYFDGRTEKTDSQGNKWTYYFNDVGIIERVVDPLGYVTQQNPNKVTATSLEWEEDAKGNRTSFTYDSDGNTASKTDPLGNTWSYTYVAGIDWLETETNPLGVITKYEYDADGNVIRMIRDFGGPLQNVTTYTYDSEGKQTSVTGPLGNTTAYEYDSNGNLIRETDPLGNVTTYTYDSRGNKLTETNAKGNTSTYTYDLMGRLLTATDALGNTITYAYDAYGNMASIQLPDGSSITYTYDAYNRLSQQTDAPGHTRTFTYDYNDNVLTVTDANGNTTTYFYDVLGRRTGTTNAEGHQTTFAYDPNGNMLSVTDANGNTTSYTYDPLNRVIQKTYADGTNYTYTYNAVGNKATEKDANGNTTTSTYDRLNRLIRKTYQDGSTASYTYDPLGRMLTGTNTDSVLAYAYDALGRVIQTSQNGKTIDYAYDSVGNRTSMTTPEGEVVSYSYNAGNQMTRLQLSSGKGIDYLYNSLGRAVRKDYSGGCYSTYAFDSVGRLAQLSHLKSDGSEIYTQTDTFDNVGNILSKTTGLGLTTYTYDRTYQVTSANHPTMPQESFTYDPVSNRLTSADHNNWNYNNRNELTDYDGTTFGYDANGNAISKTDGSGVTQYSYDYENRLKRIDFPGGGYSTYKYDVLGRRIEKNVNGQIFTYLYDGEFFVLAEYDGVGNLLQNYFNGAAGDFNPSIIYRAGQAYYVYYDRLNTPHGITNENGHLLWSAIYSSYGGILIMREDIINNFRFPGQYFDSESGLYYNGRRYYESGIGKYLTEDPDKGYKTNLYRYADNNPINKIDPTGLKVWICVKPLSISGWIDAIGYTVQPILWGVFRAHAKHCNIKIDTPGHQNYGFFADKFDGPGWVTPNPSPLGTCTPAIGVGNDQDCWDKCVDDAAGAGGNTHYNFISHNCCHWAREIISSCNLKNPLPNVNWPFNPGP